MWPIPTLEHDLITISFLPHNLVLCWMTGNTKHNNKLTVNAYERHELNNLELAHLVIFNPTRVKQIIHKFLSTHKKENAFITVSLNGLGVSEQFITMPTSTPKTSEFKIEHSSNLLWGYRFMYQNDNGEFVFYLYKIPRSLLLQYELLAIASKLNLINITTQNMALLNTYKTIFGSAFRHSQLAIDMMRHNNSIESLISTDILKKIISTSSTINLAHELPYLATVCGLFNDQGLRL